MNFLEELTWRGMIQDVMPGTSELLEREMVSAYVGIDPTADSLHIGHLVSVMILKHFQNCGHKPISLIGGATGMIGDPSMKSNERNLLDEATLKHNQESIKQQLRKFIDFDSTAPNAAEMVNNYTWMKDFTFLDFIRDVGKHITVNYMMAKDSVKKRLSGEEREGMSFTEFTYQLVQGYDYLHLFRSKNCKLQMGGSDQWGNITTGTEMIRKIEGKEAFGLTCPLIKKADGGKFGKTEKGNIWLDSRYTSVYQFYQFWINVSDEDAEKYIKIFTMLSKSEIEQLCSEHKQAMHLRKLQIVLAKEVTCLVHSEAEYLKVAEATRIIFDKPTASDLENLDESILLGAFDGVPQYNISKAEFATNGSILDLLTATAKVFPSKGELKKLIRGGGLSINEDKITSEDTVLDSTHLLKSKYILVRKGKKEYHFITVN